MLMDANHLPTLVTLPHDGENDLSVLLKTMHPTLHETEYVYCTVQSLPLTLDNVLGAFREQEGWTIILPRLIADELGLSYSFVCAQITLMVHSSLSAVGLTAAFSTILTAHGISCNVVAGYFHDHIFVPFADRHTAITALLSLRE
jgi:uncharacterized protein